MKRLWGILGGVGAILALAVAPALSATYWVAPVADGGSASNTGADTTSSPKTLTWFNANAQPGDICRFKSGDYLTEAIFPATRSGTAASRIYYYGFMEDPGAVRVANITLGRQLPPCYGDYVTVKWIKTTSGLTGLQGWTAYNYLPVGDSLHKVTGTNCTGMNLNGINCVVDSATVTGTFTITGGASQTAALSMFASFTKDANCNVTAVDNTKTSGNTVKNSTFTFTLNGSNGSGAHDFQMLKLHAAESNVFFNNTFNLTVNHATGWFFGMEGYWAVSNLFQGNTWNITMNVTPDGSRGVWCWRDWSKLNRFLGNTVTVTGASAWNQRSEEEKTNGLSFMLTNSGSCTETTERNYYGFNTIYVENPQSDAGILWFYNGTRRDTIEHNLVAADTLRPCVFLVGEQNSTVFSHNVFYTTGKTVFSGHGARVPVGQNRIANNVFYSSAGVPTATDALVEFKQGVEADSMGLFFAPAGSASYAVNNGTGAAAPSGSRNVWGTPAFEDSVYAGGLDVDVTSTYATGTEWGDGYVGTGYTGTPPTLTINHPSGELDTLWATYDVMPIVWTADDPGGAVTGIDLAWQLSSPPDVWQTIATGETNDGVYNWTITNAFTYDYAMLRITAYDADGNTTAKTVTFKCRVPVDPEDRPPTEIP